MKSPGAHNVQLVLFFSQVEQISRLHKSQVDVL